jgi:putative pyruvate formate lyase activating enzyme
MNCRSRIRKIRRSHEKKPSLPHLDRQILKKKIEASYEILQSCHLCPRRCGVNRLRDERGFCGIGNKAVVAAALPHRGEEPPLSGTGGAGTVFFSGCTMACIFCQNYQISQEKAGRETGSTDLASHFIALQSAGCHNIELVSPTPHIPFILEALEEARTDGLAIPIVYNSNGFLSEESLDLLDGVVDIYLPDMKYSRDAEALQLSGTACYVEHNRRSVKEMARQTVTDLLCDGQGIGTAGLIVRILLLPEAREGAVETIEFLAREGLATIPLSIMSQFAPLYHAAYHEGMLKVADLEWRDAVVKSAVKEGFTSLWLQEDASPHIFIPDFEKAQPFGEGNEPSAGRSPLEIPDSPS